VLFRQRPPTAKGMVFITIEDETGVVNLVVAPPLFERRHRAIITGSFLLARGILEKNGPVIYINTKKIMSIDEFMPAGGGQLEMFGE
jgi:error-prone DNA polymerase